jgi:hypothetical protein
MSKDETVIVIRSLVPGGVAAWDGRIVPGDRLMFVNSVDLAHASLDEAVQVSSPSPFLSLLMPMKQIKLLQKLDAHKYIFVPKYTSMYYLCY